MRTSVWGLLLATIGNVQANLRSLPDPTAVSTISAGYTSVSAAISSSPSHELYKRHEEDMEQDRALNAQQVACKVYSGDDSDDKKGLEPCYDFCGKEPLDNTTSGVSMHSITCLSGGLGLHTYTDSNGTFYPGVCRCNLKLLDEIAGTVVAALPAIGQIACTVLMKAWEELVQIGAMAIPGVGELDAASAGTQAIVKGARAINKAAGRSKDFESYLNKAACGSGWYGGQSEQVYDAAISGQDDQNGGSSSAPPASTGTPAPSTSAPAPPSSSSTSARSSSSSIAKSSSSAIKTAKSSSGSTHAPPSSSIKAAPSSSSSKPALYSTMDPQAPFSSRASSLTTFLYLPSATSTQERPSAVYESGSPPMVPYMTGLPASDPEYAEPLSWSDDLPTQSQTDDQTSSYYTNAALTPTY